jgi:hypothetical protein
MINTKFDIWSSQLMIRLCCERWLVSIIQHDKTSHLSDWSLSLCNWYRRINHLADRLYEWHSHCCLSYWSYMYLCHQLIVWSLFHVVRSTYRKLAVLWVSSGDDTKLMDEIKQLNLFIVKPSMNVF